MQISLGWKAMHVDSEQIARLCAVSADEKLAQDIVIFDIGQAYGPVDYFVICTAKNERLSESVVRHIQQKMIDVYNKHPLSYEGRKQSSWRLLDYGDVCVHVFSPEAREYYDLEATWGDCKKLDF